MITLKRSIKVPTIALVTFGVICLIIATGAFLSSSIKSAAALSAAQWRAGNIMSDAVFYDNTQMSASDIQAWINGKVTCDTNGSKRSEHSGGTDHDKNGVITRAEWAKGYGYTGKFVCLRDYYENTSTHANNLSTGVRPSGSISAAQIIKQAADTYKINPKILLVKLRKESPGPLTADEWPWPSQFDAALGYACPDPPLGQPVVCDPEYKGFYNQIHRAAWQLRKYVTDARSFRYKPFQNNSILYHPNTACGSSTVYIANYATAGLYNYTPYQPNKASLNAYPGTGDGCSTYGNRNFWFFYHEWFGSTQGSDNVATITGDWDGNGRSGVGIKKNNEYMFENNTADNEFSTKFSWGNSSDRVFVGDWNGDGKDELGLKRGNSYYLRGLPTLVWGNPSDRVFVGDWNGDGKDELGLQRGNTYYFKTGEMFSWGNPSDQLIVGDWDGNATTDIGLKRGNTYYFKTGEMFSWGNPSDQLIVGDWDGNATTDIGLKRGNSYYLRGLPTLVWGNPSDRVFVGDWNGDGKDELGLQRGFTFYLKDSSTNTYSIY